jgi:integrase/recombinase XerD
MSALVPLPAAPEFTALKKLVLDSVSSPITRQLYATALEDFIRWWEGQGRPSFTRAAAQAHRAELEARGYSPSTINQRLAAIRNLAREAAANGLLSAELAAGILQMPGAKLQGNRAGNWLTKSQAETLINAPDPATPKRPARPGRSGRALLVGCGLRRAEATAVTVEHIQQRDGRWVIVDLRGKHGRIRTVPVPAWVKKALDLWTSAAGITTGRVLRAVHHAGGDSESVSPQAIFAVVRYYADALGLNVKPHDLRRTCAKLCRAGGGELEQIQLLLGHASIQTTERYLGVKQDLLHAPNDRLGVRLRD